MFNRLKKLLIIALMIIAGIVFCMQVQNRAWPLISAYWLILTIKNAIDVAEM